MESLLSVIIPVYNVELYLRKCLDSIIGQTYNNMEIIIVDDGSNDASGSICEEYKSKDERIKVLHKDNGGQGSARNRALDICKGNYISFIDSDDYINRNMFEEMIQEIKNNGCDIAICGMSYDNGIKITNDENTRLKKYFTKYELMKAYLSGTEIKTVLCNKIYKSELFIGIRFPEIRAREDVYVMHEILGNCNNAIYIGECFYTQLIRANSTEQTSFKKDKLILLDIDEKLNEYVRIKFNPLLVYAKNRQIKDIIYTMKEIIKDFKYHLFIRQYDMMKQKLQSLLSEGEVAKEIEAEVKKEIVFILKYNKLFAIKYKVIGICLRFKRHIKNMVIRHYYSRDNEMKRIIC